MEVDDEDGSLFFFVFSLFLWIGECLRMLSCSLPPSFFSYRDIKSKGRGRKRGGCRFLEFLPPSCLSRPDTREIKKPWSQRTLMLKILDHVTGYRIAFLDYRFFLISQQTKEFRRILDHIPSIVITILLLEWNLRYIKTVAKKIIKLTRSKSRNLVEAKKSCKIRFILFDIEISIIRCSKNREKTFFSPIHSAQYQFVKHSSRNRSVPRGLV